MDDIDQLSGTALEFAFIDALGFRPVGRPDGAFVVYHQDSDEFTLFGARALAIKPSSLFEDLATVVLNRVLELDGTLVAAQGVSAR